MLNKNDFYMLNRYRKLKISTLLLSKTDELEAYFLIEELSGLFYKYGNIDICVIFIFILATHDVSVYINSPIQKSHYLLVLQ